MSKYYEDNTFDVVWTDDGSLIIILHSIVRNIIRISEVVVMIMTAEEKMKAG